MKKFLIFLLLPFCFMLTGCRNSNISILSEPDEEILVCKETCERGQYFHSYLTNEYEEVLDELLNTLAPHRNDSVVSLRDGQTYARDVIPRLDQISGNDIPLTLPYISLQSWLNRLNGLIEDCNSAGFCTESVGGYPIINYMDYGFDDHSGFYQLGFTDESKYRTVQEFKYNLDSDHFGYEATSYVPISSSYGHVSFYNNIYRSYSRRNSVTTFTYLNLDTKNYIQYSCNGEETPEIKVYISESEMLYYTFNYSYKVTQFDDMEFIASLFYNDKNESYDIEFSLMSMDNWDSIFVQTDWLNPSNIAYYQGERVFEEYNITVESQLSRYYNINALMTLSQTDLDDFNFRQDYTGNITFDALRKELEKFMYMDNPLDITGLRKEDIDEKVEELYTQFTSRLTH